MLVDKFLDDCISSGKFIQANGITVTPDTIIQIENILTKYNDKKARIKIRKLIQ